MGIALDVPGPPRRGAWDASPAAQKPQEMRALLVPGERFELPTNGLQNRCSTTELTRQIKHLGLVGPSFAAEVAMSARPLM